MGNRQSCGPDSSRESSKEASTSRTTTTTGKQIVEKPKPKPPSRATETDRALLQMKMQRDSLLQQKKKVQYMVDNEVQKAKDFLRDDKRNLASFCLKKKTIHEKLIGTCDNALIKLMPGRLF